MLRKTNFQTFAWFMDLHRRNLIDLEPDYQRRSVWNQTFKDFFVDSVLNNFPCPAIFLFEEISPDGVAKYRVVDGKQRLLTLFEFVEGVFPVYTGSTVASLRERFFTDFNEEQKLAFWRYTFAIEFIPTEDERLITDIFDRINRNVARLTRQELRHAKFGGPFIARVEEMTEWMLAELPQGFPAMTAQSKKQMKDCELVGNLFLLLEFGPRAFSQDDLDDIYSARDEAWETKEATTAVFQRTIGYAKELVQAEPALARSRLKNQADFYSLIGAIAQCSKALRDPPLTAPVILNFLTIVDDQPRRAAFAPADAYYVAARSNSNDYGPRQTRINVMSDLLAGSMPLPEN